MCPKLTGRTERKMDHTKDLLGRTAFYNVLEGSVQISRIISILSECCATDASTEAIALSNLWRVKQHPDMFSHNMSMEKCVSHKDIQKLSRGSIVLETTPADQGRNIASLHALASKAEQNGISILFACSITPSIVVESCSAKYENRVVAKMREEVLAGCAVSSEAAAESTNSTQTYTQASAIACNLGEPFRPAKDILTENERSLLRACGRFHSELSKDPHFGRDNVPPIIVSLPPFSTVHTETLEILRGSGANLSRVIFNQTTLSVRDLAYYKHLLANYGCSLCIDTWGYSSTFSTSISASSLQTFSTDQELLEVVLTLVQEGCKDRLILSLAVYCKIQLSAYGGCGFTYIESTIAPALTVKLSERGVAENTSDASAITRALTGGNLWKVLNWRPAPPPVAVTIDYLTCHICAQKFVPGNHFSKFGFEYCTTKCLGIHRNRDWK